MREHTHMDQTTTAEAEAEVAQLVSELIAIDSSNFGNDEGPGEAAAADYVQQRLLEVGLESERFSTTSDRRQGVYLRIPVRIPSARRSSCTDISTSYRRRNPTGFTRHSQESLTTQACCGAAVRST